MNNVNANITSETATKPTNNEGNTMSNHITDEAIQMNAEYIAPEADTQVAEEVNRIARAIVKDNPSASKSRVSRGDTDITNVSKAMRQQDRALSAGTYGTIPVEAFMSDVAIQCAQMFITKGKSHPKLNSIRKEYGVGKEHSTKNSRRYIMGGVSAAIGILHGHGENTPYDFISSQKVRDAITESIIMAKIEDNIIRVIKQQFREYPTDLSPARIKEIANRIRVSDKLNDIEVIKAENNKIAKASQNAVKYFKKGASEYYPSQRMASLVKAWNAVTGQSVKVEDNLTVLNSGVTKGQAANVAAGIYNVLINESIIIESEVTPNNTTYTQVHISQEVLDSWLVTEFLRIGNSARGMIMTSAPEQVTELVGQLPSITSTVGLQVCSAKYSERGNTDLATQAINIFNQTRKYVNQEYLAIAEIAFYAGIPDAISQADIKAMSKTDAQRAQESNRERSQKVSRFNNAMDMAKEIADAPYWAMFNKEWRGRYNEAITGLSSHTGSIAKPFLLIDATPAVIEVLEDNIGKMLSDNDGNNMEKDDIADRMAQVKEYNKDIRQSVIDINNGLVSDWVKSKVEPKGYGLYYAAAMDIVKAYDNPAHESGIVIPTDQNCSAIGFLGAIAKDMNSIRAVNLVGSETRQDIYEMAAANMVADYPKSKQVKAFMNEYFDDVKPALINRVATVVINNKSVVKRSLLKPSIMTAGYGSVDGNVKWAVVKTLRAVMDENNKVEALAMQVIGEMVIVERRQLLEESNNVMQLFTFMAKKAIHNEDAIKSANTAKNPTQYNKAVKGHSGQGVLSWTVADGMVVGNQYNAQGKSHGASLDANKMDVKAASNGISANKVHSHDAALMTMVAVEMNCPLVPIHDSWGVSSGNFLRLQEVVRRVFKETMENNTILRDFVADNRHMFTDKDLLDIDNQVEHILRNEADFNMDGMETNQWNWS